MTTSSDDTHLVSPQTTQSRAAAIIASVEAADRAREVEAPPPTPWTTAEPAGSLGEGVRRGAGWGLLGTLFGLQVVDELDRVALAVLAPDLQRSLGISDAALGAVAGAAGVFLVLGAVPLGMAADRHRRTTVGGLSTIAWAVIVFATSFVGNAFTLFWARMGTGLGQSNLLPVQNALASDAYPPSVRGRVFGLLGSASPLGRAVGPLVVGGVAAVAGGDDGWRWAFRVIAVPSLLLGLALLFQREPRRGRFEREANPELVDDGDAPPVSFAAAFDRLRAIQTFHHVLLGVGALGFALFSVPIFLNLQLDERFGLSAFARGGVLAVAQLPALVALPLFSRRYDRVFRSSPPVAVRLLAALIASYGPLIALATWMPTIALLGATLAVATTATACTAAMLPVLMSAVIPFRLRSQGFAIVGIYIFLGGGFLGAVLTGWLADAWGESWAITLVAVPASLLGGWLLSRGARHIVGDVHLVVEELEEEAAERRRLGAGADLPAIQVRGLDFSYGQVQVLFDVGLDVRRGETLALLGTNGAGKSTLLRCLSGLGTPSRGVVRLHGTTMTFADPARRVDRGVVLLPGGKAVFPDLSVHDNLRLGAFALRDDRRRVDERIEAVVELFPELAARLDVPAGDLSGGQQQMVALAKALLLEPDVLLIDELSLGLAPVVVASLLEILEALKAEGQTMVLVEQSVNVALSIADRAVFMERGTVCFEGPAEELRHRDDLLRAVFLGPGEG